LKISIFWDIDTVSTVNPIPTFRGLNIVSKRRDRFTHRQKVVPWVSHQKSLRTRNLIPVCGQQLFLLITGKGRLWLHVFHLY